MNPTDTANSPNTINNFILIIILAALMVFVIRALMNYRNYKGTIFQELYSNYLIDYYYKLNVFHDVSKSGRLKPEIGYHRLVYSNFSNREGQVVTQIVSVIHSKGIISIAYYNPAGKLRGGDTKDWYIERTVGEDNKRYRIENPVVHLQEYAKRVKELTKVESVEKVMAIADGNDCSAVHISIPLVKYSEIIDKIKQSNCGYGLDQMDIDSIYEKLGGKISK